MRFCVPIVLKDKSDPDKTVALDSNYNGKFLSLIKLGLSSTNPELFNYLYGKKTSKDFATSIYFPSAQFDHGKILLNRDGKVLLNFTTSDRTLGFNFFNAFMYLHQQSLKAEKKQGLPLAFDKNLNVNVWKLSMISTHEIQAGEALFKTLSPVLLMDSNKKFVVCESADDTESYNNVLQSYLMNRFASKPNMQKLFESVKFEPIKTRVDVRNLYGHLVPATSGIFRLTGDPQILTYIQDSGLGMDTGSYFGMLEQIK